MVVGYFFVISNLNEIEKLGTTTLSNLEHTVDTPVYDLGHQVDSMSSNVMLALSLKSVLGNSLMDQKELVLYDTVRNIFSSFEIAYPYVDTVYFYLDGYDRFIDSRTRQIADVNTFYDKEWFDIYKNMNPEEKVFTKKRWLKEHTYDEPVEVISIYYRNTYLKGVIVINIDKNKYGTFLRQAKSDYQNLLLVNSNGEIISTTDQKFETDPPVFLEDSKPSEIKNKIMSVNNSWTNIGNELSYVTLQRSENLNVYEVSIISVQRLYKQISYYTILMLLLLLLDIVIIITMAYVYTKRSFYYINECVSYFHAAEQGQSITQKENEVKDEYGLILNNVIFLHLRGNQMQMELLEKQHEKEITEMMGLQLQINPHFIFNTLQIIEIESVRSIGSDSALRRMVQQLSKVVKYALNNPTEDVALGDEIDYLKAYLEIQKVRFGDSIITYFEIDEDLLDCKVFRLLLQPMLENSFKHGKSVGKQQMVVKVKVIEKEHTLHFSIIDNGVGMSKEELNALRIKINSPNSKGIGLTNVNQRLILHYGQHCKLRILSKKNTGTVIQFIIPKNF